MQTTEKLNIPFQSEINHFAEIQVLQSEHFDATIEKQFKLFNKEYKATLKSFYSNDQQELIKKIELVNFLFAIHMQSFKLPKVFEHSFNLLKIITAKSALYHSDFFVSAHNPVAHYLSTVSSHIKQKLNKQNQKEFLKLLNDNIQVLIIQYQSDPSFFDVQTKAIINSFKLSKTLKNTQKAPASPSLKTSSLKDSFSRDANHLSDVSANKVDNQCLFLAKNVRKGDWVNLQQKGQTTLIKLIWKADDNSEFIFVNKDGEKVRQCNLIELAADFENNIITSKTTNKNSARKNISILKTIG